MRHTHQGTFGHARHVVDVAFNFSWVDVVPTTDDQVFAAAHNDHIATFIVLAHIACFEKTVCCKFFFCFLGHAPVSLENIRAFDLNVANLAHGQVLAIVALHAQLDTRQRKTHCATTAFTLATMALISCIGVGGEHDCFTHAIALQNGVPSALLPFRECFNEQGCRTRNEQTHVAHSLLVQGRLGQHAHIQRGHAHEDGGLGHFGNDKFGVKFGEPNHFAAIDERTMKSDEQTVNVKDRQGMNEHIALFPTPIGFQSLRVAEHVAMRQHGAFASARGAAGVQNSSQVVGILKHHLVLIFLMRSALKQGACSIVIQSEHMLRACFECNFANPSKIGT